MAERPLKYRDLVKRLRLFGVVENKTRGKGSHRMLIRVVEGVKCSYPIRCHHEGEVKPRAVIGALRRRLRLTDEDGISDEDFYGK
jgi:hypothetical protein